VTVMEAVMEAPTRTDEELIAYGRSLVQRRDKAMFDLGLVVLQYAPVGPTGAKTGVLARVNEFADAIGIDRAAIYRYRTVAHSWQGHDVDGLNFSTLWALMPVEDKAGLLDAMSEAGPPQGTRGGRWTMQTAVQFAREHGFWPLTERGSTHTLTSIFNALRKTTKGLSQIPTMHLSDYERDELRVRLGDLALELSAAREAVRR
jgi:hypothetical protein